MGKPGQEPEAGADAPIAAEDWRWLHRFARTVAGSDADAEDLVQEAWLVAGESASQADSARAWLSGVVGNRARMLRRASLRRRRREAVAASQLRDDVDPESATHRSAVLDALRTALAELDDEDRVLLAARYGDDQPAADLARSLGIPASTVRTRLSRATARVRRSLDDRFDGDRRAWAPALVLLTLPRGSRGPAWLTGAVLVSTTTKIIVALLGLAVAVAVWLAWRSPDDLRTDLPGSTEHAATDGRMLADARRKPAASAGAQKLPRAAIEGTVFARGSALPGATVCAAPDTDSLSTTAGQLQACATTGHDGHYRIEGLFATRYRVAASAPEHRPAVWSRGHVDVLRLDPRVTTDGIDLHLRTGGVEVRGVVKDISGGVVAGAVVELQNPRRVPSYSIGIGTVTDDEGAFSLWAAPGRVAVAAAALGYGSTRAGASAPGMQVELVLTPESVLVGRVVSAQSGEPVADARVGVAGGWYPFTGRYPEGVLTDANGEFRLEGLSPGAYTAEVFDPRGYGRADRRVGLGFAEVSEPVTIEMHPAQTVEGHVLVEDAGEESACSSGHVQLEERKTADVRAAPIGVDGHVAVVAVIPGTWRVSVVCDGAVRTMAGDVVVGDEPLELQRWTVARGATVTGTVTDDSGRPIPDVMVAAEPVDPGDEPTWAQSNADAEGRFVLEGLRPARYAIKAYSREHVGHAEVEVAVPERSEGVRLELSGGATLRGSVTDATGAPVPGLRVRLTGANDTWQDVRDDGTFEIRGLVPGDVRVTVEADGNPLPTPGRHADAMPGEAVTITTDVAATVSLVVVSTHETIRGTVTHGDSPVVDAFVSATLEGQGGSRSSPSVLTDQDGHFVLEGLRPGDYTVRAHRRGGGGEGETKHVPSGGTTEVDLAHDGEIAGRVSGPAPEGFSVLLSNADSGGSRQFQRLFRTSEFRFDSVGPGNWNISVETPEGSGAATVELEEGASIEGIEVTLAPRVSLRGTVRALETGEPVEGCFVHVAVARGAVASFPNRPAPDGRSHITDAEGRFEVHDVVPGRVALQIGPYAGCDRSRAMFFAPVPEPDESGFVTLAPIDLAAPLPKTTGDLGFEVGRVPTAAAPESTSLVVSLVRSGGPAEAAGLEVGDVIASIGDHDVTERRRYLFGALTTVAPGTRVELGLAGGGYVVIVAGRP